MNNVPCSWCGKIIGPKDAFADFDILSCEDDGVCDSCSHTICGPCFQKLNDYINTMRLVKKSDQ